jgi:hypothetical protein
MSLAVDLLEQADHLSRREAKKPRQVSLGRSISTSYYALFHLLCSDAAAIMAPNVSDSARGRMQRTFRHEAIKQVCARFLQTPLSATLANLIEAPASPEMRVVALAFTQLQDARHSADYDLNATWDREDARHYVLMTGDAFKAWSLVKKRPEANIFLICFLLQKVLEGAR